MQSIARLFIPILSVMLISACVPVALVEKDVEVEKLQDGIYYLNVTAKAETDSEQVKQQWHKQAKLLCAGHYHHDAHLFKRSYEPRRFINSEYKQMRGNLYCN